MLEEKVMLQKLKVTSKAFIYFLVFGFSFIALQVTTGEAEAVPYVTTHTPGETVGKWVADFMRQQQARVHVFRVRGVAR